MLAVPGGLGPGVVWSPGMRRPPSRTAERRPARDSRARTLLLGSLALSVLLLTACQARRPAAVVEHEARGVLVGLPAPAFVGCQALLGTAPPLEGRVTLINFWGWWCPPCMAEMPLLQEFHGEHEGGDIQVVGVTALRAGADAAEERGRMADVIERFGLTFPNALCGQTCLDYRVESWPTSVLVDAAGLVVDYGIGESGTRRLMARAETLAGR
jgi:thiol-disulfide isomerase/thioredoxin